MATYATIGALIGTYYTIFSGIPCYNYYSIISPQALFQLLRPLLYTLIVPPIETLIDPFIRTVQKEPYSSDYGPYVKDL